MAAIIYAWRCKLTLYEAHELMIQVHIGSPYTTYTCDAVQCSTIHKIQIQQAETVNTGSSCLVKGHSPDDNRALTASVDRAPDQTCIMVMMA